MTSSPAMEGATAQSNLVQNRKIIFFILTCAVGLLAEHARASEQLIRSFAPGPGLNAVGVIEANPDAGGTEASVLGDHEEIEGPQALHAGEHGEIYILDQVNSRVLRLDPKRPAERGPCGCPRAHARPTSSY